MSNMNQYKSNLVKIDDDAGEQWINWTLKIKNSILTILGREDECVNTNKDSQLEK